MHFSTDYHFSSYEVRMKAFQVVKPGMFETAKEVQGGKGNQLFVFSIVGGLLPY